MEYTPSNKDAVEQLRWKKFPVLDDGHVMLVDCMGDDDAVVQAARVSYGAGTKSVSDNETLIRYLMRHRHSTPFEMVEIKFRVRVPMDCWRQWIRHRTANVNEYSTRYSEAIDSRQTTSPEEWRSQNKNNKQGSGEFLTDWPESPDKSDFVGPLDGHLSIGKYLSNQEEEFHIHAEKIYQERLALGVAREQARKDLPLSTYTEAYWKIDLHNLFHFLGLRLDSHAQKEIREYADAMYHIILELFPLCCAAFEDYRLNAMTLSALDQYVLEEFKTVFQSNINPRGIVADKDWSGWPKAWRGLERCRERDECIAKLERLGFLN